MSTVPLVSTSIVPNHTVEIIAQNGSALLKEPLPKMTVGETVRYVSGDGEVTIVFPGRSPFRLDGQTNTEVHGQVILTLVSDSGEGDSGLACHCSLTLKNGQTIGWPNDPSLSGGDHHVKQP
jgi:hypothetical protein